MAIAPDGTLYIATQSVIYSVPHQRRVPAPNTRILKGLEDISGIAVSADMRHLLVTHHNGMITEINLKNMKRREVVKKGTKGKCIAFGPDGCIYAAQTQEILRITTSPDGSCPGDLGPNPEM